MAAIAAALGFDGRYLYSIAFGSANPNLAAAFPSLHVAYPFLAFLVLRRAFGAVGWLALGYTGVVALSVLYTGDHWLIDCIAGISFAYVAFYAVAHAPERLRARRPAGPASAPGTRP